MGVVLGIDTSNYTTSLAVVNRQGNVLADVRKLLPVSEGSLGLRQSEALFLHIKHWPELVTPLQKLLGSDLEAVAVSDKPRPQEGSYMPSFLAGVAQGASIAAALGVPLYSFSHQEGHIRAALYGTKGVPMLNTATFLAVHISGGTTDIMLVSKDDSVVGFSIATLGGSQDLHAGQFIDRVGVAMGLAFPCGAAMDSMAAEYAGEPYPLPAAVQGANISFSGPETAAQRALESGVPPGAIASGVFRCIGNALEKALRHVLQDYPVKAILLCGGVAANSHLRTRLQHRLSRLQICVAPAGLATDNAVGIALLGLGQLC